MSFLSTLKSDAALALHELKIGSLAVEKVVASVAGNPQAQAAIEGLSAAVLGPASATVEGAVFNVAGELSKLLTGADSISKISQLENLGFDKTILADFKAVIASVKSV